MEIPKGFEYLEINDQIERALESIFYAKRNTLIIGNAGTGKSEILSVSKAIAEKNRISSVFLAPTGIAAVRIEGQTIHSFFKLPLSMIEAEFLPLKEEVRDLINSTDIFFIDEVSMIRADILEAMDSLVRRSTEVYHRFFGGKQIVLVGDLYQLPPIVGSSIEEKTFYKTRFGDNPYFFSSSIFNMFEDEFTKVEFTKIYRQKNSDFSDILNRVRKGKQTDEDLDRLNENLIGFNSFKKENEEAVYLSPYNKIVNGINKKYLMMLETDEYLFPANIKGSINFKNHMVPKELILKPGAKIMTLINNFDKGYQNGSVGTFIRVIDKENLLLEIKGEDVVVSQKEFIEYSYEVEEKKLVKKQKGSIFQFPLKLCYAQTIHKSQGQTFEAGYIDLATTFGFHSSYVALSRFKDLNKIGLKRKITHSDIRINPFVIEFMKTFQYSK